MAEPRRARSVALIPLRREAGVIDKRVVDADTVAGLQFIHQLP